MANQLKRKRSGSPVAIIRGLVVGVRGDSGDVVGAWKHILGKSRTWQELLQEPICITAGSSHVANKETSRAQRLSYSRCATFTLTD